MRLAPGLAPLAVVISAAIAHPRGPSGAAARCSLVPVFAGRSATTVWFVGTAEADTVEAGPGSVNFNRGAPGHYGPAGEGAFRGQLVRVERLDRQAGKELRKGVEQSQGRMVMVGWDYAADCGRLPLTSSAAWARPGSRGLFHGELRPRSEWAGGIPTVDVFAPEFSPYPFAPGLARAQDGDLGRRWLTADELFEYVSDYPVIKPGQYPTKQLLAWGARWAREHPGLASLQPVAGDLAGHRSMHLSEVASFHRLKSPIAGTWHFLVVLARGDTFRLFGRTSEHPIGASYGPGGLPEDAATRPPVSYDLYSRFSTTPPVLDSVVPMDAPGTVEGYLELATEPMLQTRDSTVWRGSMHVGPIARHLLLPLIPGELFIAFLEAQRKGDTTALPGLRVRGLTDQWRDLYVADSLWMKDRFSGREGARFQGRYVRLKDGSWRGAERIERDGVVLMTMRAERLSDKHYPGDMPPRARIKR